MRRAVSIKSVPKVHVFYPNDDICVDGVNALLEFAEKRGLQNEDRIPYFNRVKNPKFYDFEPVPELYILQQASRRIKVGDLKKLLNDDLFHDTYRIRNVHVENPENEYP